MSSCSDGPDPSRRRSAHDRLLDGAAGVAGRDGYAQLTVERVLAAAGVSRATFYQYFSNVDDCFSGAYRQSAEQLVSDVEASVRGSEHRELAVLDVLVDTAIRRPQRARLLMREGLAAGPMGRSERDALISRIEHAMTGSGPHQATIDLPAAMLIGGMFRFLSMRLADGSALDGLHEEVRRWAGTFARRSSQPSWSARFAPALPRDGSRTPAHASRLRPRGAPRERILRAAVATVAEKRYRDVTVADIVEAAGVSRRGFYNQFPSKSAAFIASYEHAFQQSLAACTPAFFAARAWPERVWHGVQALTRFFSREPSFAYLGFVECYAIGPGFVMRVHDTQLAFTLFLEEGYQQRPEAQSLSRMCSALTATAIFELGFQVSRRGPGLYMRRMQPLAVYVALTPFIGSDAAGAFVADKLSAMDSAAPAAA
jgi:AcrR family transcriptional regulator